MPVKATTLEEQRTLDRRRRKREEQERAKATRITPEEEIATYFGICPLFTEGLLELSEPQFISLMLRTREFMLRRMADMQRGETVNKTYWKRKS